jgi:hypothetical protein
MKNMFTAFVGRCCPFRSRPTLSSCNVSGVSTITGSTSDTDFLESCAERPAIFPEF